MKIIARPVIYSWKSGMVTRYAHFASMTHVREYGSSVDAFAAKRLPVVQACRPYPLCRHQSPPSPRIVQRSPVPRRAGTGTQAVPYHRRIPCPVAF